ncbi:MAG: hypothetical protein UX13_C0007G0015 [Candidatus Woesebacteria bacterium GW2011_GWB1_45_5]|uniref:Peptidase C39 domain-containing protein n=1 Tax=Candidatus Woesebacteria bacterium GW2011_GWB1_45_5 TaxID=1618581 RepID=A0A0G1MQL4_9BACT|nr:MAG: hypothetical protein UX13_C0007G0015 [Candidatus Woesebacteria bacterium GW2011_GWB1_45_5]
MKLEKNPQTRKLYRKLLSLVDKTGGLAFPRMTRVKQISSSHCGPAVIQTLFSFLGVRVSQTGIVRSLRVQKKIRSTGLNFRELSRAVGFLGKKDYVFWRKNNASIDDLSKIVNKYKYPVGVEWQGVFYEDEDEDNGHYSVVTKVDKEAGFLRMSDPYPKFAGIDRKFEIKFFVKRWWDVNIINGRKVIDKKMIFVITPKKETWPKKLGMKK